MPVQVRLPFPARHSIYRLAFLHSSINRPASAFHPPPRRPRRPPPSPCTHHTDPFCVCTRFWRILFFFFFFLCVLFVHFQSAGLLLLQHCRSTEREQSRPSLSPVDDRGPGQSNWLGWHPNEPRHWSQDCTHARPSVSPTAKSSRSQLFCHCQSNSSASSFAFRNFHELNRLRAKSGRHGFR